MNLDERIATSWKDHWNSSGLHVGESFTDFRAGYLTAMRQSLEVDFEKCDQIKESNQYWAMVPDIGWRKGVVVGVGLGLDFIWRESNAWYVIRASSAILYCRICDWLPSPEEIFGEVKHD